MSQVSALVVCARFGLGGVRVGVGGGVSLRVDFEGLRVGGGVGGVGGDGLISALSKTLATLVFSSNSLTLCSSLLKSMFEGTMYSSLAMT